MILGDFEVQWNNLEKNAPQESVSETFNLTLQTAIVNQVIDVVEWKQKLVYQELSWSSISVENVKNRIFNQGSKLQCKPREKTGGVKETAVLELALP